MSFSVHFARTTLAALVLAGFGITAACGGGDGNVPPPGGDDDGDSTSGGVATPSVLGVSGVWHAGDVIKVAGSNFLVPSDGGTVTLHFTGSFTGDGGSADSVDWEIEATPRQSNRVDFTFEPDAEGFGTTVGTFTGKLSATNISKTGKEATSQPVNANVTVGPSIVITNLSPDSTSCDEVRTKDTLKGAVMNLAFDVSGLGGGTSYTPITMSVTWVDINGAAQSLTKNVSSGTSGSVQIDTGTPSPLDDDAPNDKETLASDIGISLQASDGDGNTISRRVVVTVHEELSVVYNGETQIVEVFEPQVVSGCLGGGQTGNSFNYSENTSEGRSRGYSLSASIGINVWVLNLGFGFGVNESISSSSGVGTGISHSVFPHWNGAFFRQTSKLWRTGQIVRWDDCGTSVKVGTATVTDWVWAPGFNQKADSCPPLPEPLMSDAGIVELN